MTGRSDSIVRSPPDGGVAEGIATRQSNGAPPALEIADLTKRYGRAVAVDRLSLRVARGQLVALLGPSGCGKTTTLRMIAGLVEPTEGRIVLDGRPVERVPIHRRNIGMVFQQYALFPFLSVFDNVAYGLRERPVPKPELRKRVISMLGLVGLSGLEQRRPQELSGGQQQRVALARALVINPSLLLLDEPLSNLDTKLRERVRGEIRDLQKRLGITTIFVTHDQDEALSIAHVIVVMRGGRIEQEGTPLEIYRRPANAFVADFIGACNLLPARVMEVDDETATCAFGAGVTVRVASLGLRAGDDVTLAIRPERMSIAAEAVAPAGGKGITGLVSAVSYLGSRTSYEVDAAGVTLRCDMRGESELLAPGTPVTLHWGPASWQPYR
jgi:ABC-type Fe3+/spermidine/putrescine transport system ATPase subunit